MLSKKISVLLIGILFFTSVDAQIWPGDVNNNGKADQVDLLYVGWAFGNSGSEREIMGTDWEDAGWPIEVWQEMFPDETSYAFADCDGNGEIDDSDFDAVTTNYYNEHGTVLGNEYLNGTPNQDPALEFELSANTIFTGEELTVELYLGNNDFTIEEFHGIAVALSYTSQHGTPLSSVEYLHDANSWVNTNSEIFSHARHNVDLQEIGLAVTRKTGKTVNGDGRIGSFSIIIEDIVLSYDVDTIHLQIDSIKMIGGDFMALPVAISNTEFIVRRAPQDECPIEIVMTENSCSSFTFVGQNPVNEQLFWSVNGEYTGQSGTSYTFNTDEAGTYEICGGYETPECPQGAFQCYTVVVGSDCFDNECPLDVAMIENSCSSFTFIVQNPAEGTFFWSVNDEYIDQPSQEFAFNATQAGTYQICAVHETPECPQAVFECFTLTVSEDCLGNNPCDFQIGVDPASCSEFFFFTTQQEQVDWFVNQDYISFATGFSFEANQAGTYEICALIETPDCPLGASVCQTIVIDPDCFDDECPIEIVMTENSCSSFTFVGQSPVNEQLFWSVNDEYIDQPGTSFTFNTDEAGTYEICGGYETPECPQGAFQCYTVVVGPDCFDNECPFDVIMIENSCSSFTFIVQNPAEGIFFWSINDEYIDQSSQEFTFDAIQAGTYQICAVYETPECPQAVFECFTLTVSEDCLGNNPCDFQIDVDPASCSEFFFFTTQQEQVDWFVNQDYISFATGFSFEANQAGTYEICALIETPDCPLGASVCQTIVIDPDCFDEECPIDIAMIENSCSSFTFIGQNPVNEQLFWSINGEYTGQSGTSYTFNTDEAGTYEICGGYETGECPLGAFQCYTVVVDQDCFENGPCDFQIDVDPASCSSFFFFTTQQEQVDWFVNQDYISFAIGFNFEANQAGTYEICALIETPDCPLGATVCETIVIDPDCFDDECPLDIVMTENSCSSFTFVGQSPVNDQLFWSINGEYIDQSGPSFTFEATEAGTYEICGGYETPECPQGVFSCKTISVSEECIEGLTDLIRLEEELYITLAPNPSHDYLVIGLSETSEISYQIMDMSGRTIISATPQIILQQRLDISQLANGVYLIHAVVNGASTTLRFIKQ